MDEDRKQFEDLLAEQRHTELIQSISEIKKALTVAAMSELDLKKIIEKNTDAINNFGKVPDVNVISNHEDVVKAMEVLSQSFTAGMLKMEERISLMEEALKKIANRPLPEKLQAVRPNKYNDQIEFMVIEYKNTNN